MGDIADMLYIEGILGNLDGDSYGDPISFKFRELRCKYCGYYPLHWIYYNKKWKLVQEAPRMNIELTLHECRKNNNKWRIV